jgi:glucan phosphoethanolaminetransferase (alkaline phosphatase superfamily)
MLLFSLTILWGLFIVTAILSILIIDSYDCSIFENGWDKVCNTNNENHKKEILQITPILGIVFSALFIIIFSNSTSHNSKSVVGKRNA